MKASTPWLTSPHRRPDAATRLFCFPPAGGGASMFYRWPESLDAGVEVWSVRLPGRENRVMEPAFLQMEPLVEDLYPALLPFLDRPFAFFGHSLGAWVAFEIARRSRERYGRVPIYFFAAGASAPDVRHRNPEIRKLPDDEFLRVLIELGGIPKVALENPELLSLMLPTVRADFTIYETYRHVSGEPLSCPIGVFGGIDDPRVMRSELESWSEHTSGGFSLQMFPGDHFFVNSAYRQILQTVNSDLGRAARSAV